MAGGGKVQIIGTERDEIAQVVNGRLLVSSTGGGGGGGGDVNIDAVGGVPIGSTVPISGTVSVVEPVSIDDNGGSITVDGTVGVSGTVAVTQSTSPWVVSGTVAVSNFPATQAVTQSTSPWVVGDGGGSLTVDGSVSIAAATGSVSAGNSTATPLAGAATFTGVFESVKDYAGITITVFSTQASATDGMKLQWSHDGVNVDREDTFTVLASQGRAFGVPVEGQFFRIVYTNGATLQVTFRLGVVYKPTAPGLNAVSITEDIPVAGAVVVGTRSVITGESSGGGGSFVNVKVNPSGAMVVDPGVVAVIGTVTVNQGTSPWVVGGTVAVSNFPATQAVTQSTSPWVVGDGGGSLTVDGTVNAAQDGSWNVEILGSNGSSLEVQKESTPVIGANETGIAPFFEVGTPGAPLADATWAHAYINVSGRILADVTGTVSIATQPIRVLVEDSDTANNLNTPQDGEVYVASSTRGVAAMFAVGDPGTLTNDTWSPASLSSVTGRLLVSTDGEVSITAIIPGVGALQLGKAEDAPHTTGDVGVMSLAVRSDAGGPLGANGDYHPLLVDSTGRLICTVSGLAPGTAAGNLGKAEDALHTSGDVGVMALGVRQDASSALAANGDYIPLSLNATGHLRCTIAEINPGTTATSLGKAEDSSHVTGDTGVMSLAVRQDVLAALAGVTGDYIPLTTDEFGRLNVMQRGGKATYRSAANPGFVAAAGTGIFFVIAGSSTRTIIVQRIVISGFHLTAVEYNTVICSVFGVAPTGGTATALSQTRLDTANAAATASLVQIYTAAPTIGSASPIASRRILMQAAATATGQLTAEVVFDFRNLGENHGAVLRGTAQNIGIQFGAAPASAVTLTIEVEWTEEP